MAARQQQWSIALSSLWILAVIFWRTIAVVSSQAISESIEHFGPNIDTVTSSTIRIWIPCLLQNTCALKDLKYKKLGDLVYRQIQLENFTRIHNLEADTEYHVVTSVQLINTKIVTEGKIIRTCPKQIPKLFNLRKAKAGPGWMDLRWTPVRDTHCKSKIIYMVQYISESFVESVSSPMKAYGLIRASDGTLLVRPWHPCAAWDKEFCLLLTDFVKPGKNHTVKVMPLRYDPDLPAKDFRFDQSSNVYQELVYADPTVTGPYTFGQADATSFCAPQIIDGKTKTEGRSMDNRVMVSVWIIVLAVFILLSAVIVLIAAWIWKIKSKSSKPLLPKEYPHTSSPPVCQENDYDDTERVSRMYDDCMTTVHSGGAPATTKHQQMAPSKRFQGMTSSLPKNIAAEAAARVGAAAKSEVTSKTKDDNDYLDMHSQPIYDDAQGLARNYLDQTYSNLPENERDSNLYMEPSSPIYEEAKMVAGRESAASVAYNEVYSHSPEGPWRSW